MRCLAAGKHVLLEKPSTNNAAEAEELFRFAEEKGRVLLEARHYQFQPGWKVFIGEIDRENVEKVYVNMCGPALALKDDDIRFRYELGGGAMMDLGTYHVSALRAIFGDEPEDCEFVATLMVGDEGMLTKHRSRVQGHNAGTAT